MDDSVRLDLDSKPGGLVCWKGCWGYWEDYKFHGLPKAVIISNLQKAQMLKNAGYEVYIRKVVRL